MNHMIRVAEDVLDWLEAERDKQEDFTNESALLNAAIECLIAALDVLDP